MEMSYSKNHLKFSDSFFVKCNVCLLWDDMEKINLHRNIFGYLLCKKIQNKLMKLGLFKCL